ncbi:MAG TPA: hypothetical protein VF690_03305 [Hymenobacter sp.]
MSEKLAPLPSSSSAATGRRLRRWLWWLLGLAGLAVALGLVASHFLDPWLRRTLEKQVAEKTHGQYRLQIGELRTNVWERAVRLRRVRLRPAANLADSLPRVRLDAARLHVTGMGLLALWRRGTVPVDSVVLDSAYLEVLALAKRPAPATAQPWHEQLPLRVAGLTVRYLGLLHTQARYLPHTPQAAEVGRADLTARDLRISPAGAADSQRVGYAAAWRLHVLQAEAQVAGHRWVLGAGQLSTADGRLQLDSLRVRPAAAPGLGQPRVDLTLPHLLLTGVDAAAWQHRHRLRADSLLIERPQLTLALAAQAAPHKDGAVTDYAQSLNLAHLAVRQGKLRVLGSMEGLVQDLNVGATALRLAPSATPAARRTLSAQSWTAALGPSRATVAAHQLALGSGHLSTEAGTLDLRALRIRPPRAGQGSPGAVRVDLALPRLAMAGLDAAAWQHRQHFRAASLALIRPVLRFTPPTQPPPPVWKVLAAVARRVDLAQLRVQRAQVQIGDLRHSPELHDLNVVGHAIRIDSGAAREPRRIAYARAWRAQSGLVTVPFDPPYYRAASQRLRLDTDAQTLRLDALTLRAKYSAVGMNLHKGYQAPAIDLKMKALVASGLDFAALVRRRDFRVDRVTALHPVLHIASDGRGPINPNKSKITPETMSRLQTIIDVRRLDIKDGHLYSWYRSPRTPIAGTMSINRFNGSFFNLSNDPQRQTPATPFTARASTYLQNQCRLDAQLSAYLFDPRGRHRVWGTFGPGTLTMINSMTEPTRLVRFKSGDVRRLRFDLQADRQGVTGQARTEYSGLQMTLLSYQEAEVKQTLFSRLKSKAVNVVVIRDENPRKGGTFVTGTMTSTREPRFSVFTLWRQGIVSGLFHNVGVPQKLAQKLSESKDEGPLPK